MLDEGQLRLLIMEQAGDYLESGGRAASVGGLQLLSIQARGHDADQHLLAHVHHMRRLQPVVELGSELQAQQFHI